MVSMFSIFFLAFFKKKYDYEAHMKSQVLPALCDFSNLCTAAKYFPIFQLHFSYVYKYPHHTQYYLTSSSAEMECECMGLRAVVSFENFNICLKRFTHCDLKTLNWFSHLMMMRNQTSVFVSIW